MRSISPGAVATIAQWKSAPMIAVITLSGCSTVADVVDFNETELDEVSSSRRLRGELRSYVGNVYRYHRQYIYDVVLYQYQQDQPPDHQLAAAQNQHTSSVLVDILGDAQQVH